MVRHAPGAGCAHVIPTSTLLHEDSCGLHVLEEDDVFFCYDREEAPAAADARMLDGRDGRIFGKHLGSLVMHFLFFAII